MSEVEATPSEGQNPLEGQKPVKKKRAAWERAVVWGGILLLLAIVLVEWRSREGHNATLESLEKSLSPGHLLPTSELPQHIRGFAFRGEEKHGSRQTITLKWPSLFKTYKLRLELEGADQVFSVTALGAAE